jgi:transposase
MSLLGRLVPDHKTIADFRKDNGPGIGKVCTRFVELSQAKASVAIDGSKFKAMNNRDRNFTRAKAAKNDHWILPSVRWIKSEVHQRRVKGRRISEI